VAEQFALQQRLGQRGAMTLISGPRLYDEFLWIISATDSLPEPVSPVISTFTSERATRPIVLNTSTIAGVVPTICSFGSRSPSCAWSAST
jgi:hypothetical protein